MIFIFFFSLILIAGGCLFPERWWGVWYQPQFGRLVIEGDYFSSKGHCFVQHRQFYLLVNRSSGCNICILFSDLKHDNVLKYKESNCLHESYDVLCSDLANSNLYIIIRENSTEAACPLSGFSRARYRNQSEGECRYPPSWLQKCAGNNSRFHLRLKHCVDVPATRNADIFLECVAKWKEEENHYFFAKFVFLENRASTTEEQYKCFLYRFEGENLRLWMSADATCQDLDFPTPSQFSMILQSDENSSEKSLNCTSLKMNYHQNVSPKKITQNSFHFQPATASSYAQNLTTLPNRINRNNSKYNKLLQNCSKSIRMYKIYNFYIEISNIFYLTLYILFIYYIV